MKLDCWLKVGWDLGPLLEPQGTRLVERGTGKENSVSFPSPLPSIFFGTRHFGSGILIATGRPGLATCHFLNSSGVSSQAK